MATRRERVVLELEDRFSTDMAKAAAATALLNRELNSLSGTSVETSRGTDRVKTSVKGVGDEVGKTDRQFRDGEKSIDRYSGRLRLLTEAAVLLGPALIPIGAAAIPAVVALAASLGAAAGAAGVAMLAFNGVGDALKSIDAYQLEPTQANLEKMRQQMEALGPAGAEFARYLNGLQPQLHALQDAARAGLFPGVEDGLNSLLGLLPQVRTIIFDVATAMGKLASEAGAGLAGPAFSDFFNYLQTDARPTLEALGHTIGNVAQGLASLTVAFAPLSRDFSSGMESMSRSFADWAAGLSETQGFHDFVAYVRESGPQVVQLLGALATAFIGIVQAAAPVGNAVLPALTALATVLGKIADSPIGQPLFTAAAALIAVSRAATLVNAGLAAVEGNAMLAAGGVRGLVAAGVALGGVIVTANLLQQAMDRLGNTRLDSSNLNRDLTALANGDVVDNLNNIGSAFQDIDDKWQRDANPLSWVSSWDPSGFEAASDTINSLDQALATMVESGDADTAARAFAAIQEQAGKVGVSADEAASRFPEYAAALDNTAAASDHAADATRRLGRNAGLTKSEVAGLTSAMLEQKNAAIGAFDAVTQYAQALAAARKRARESNAGINASTKAGQENRAAISQLAQAWNNQGEAVRNNLSKYAAARQALIQTAEGMGVASGKARRLADDMLAIPKFIATRVDAYTDKAKSQIQGILTELASIPRSISTTYYVNQVNRINKTPEIMDPTGQSHAEGGTIRGPRQPYGDKVLTYLAPGEEVISNRYGQADRNRDLLKSINANRMAVGGTVGDFARRPMPRSRGVAASSVNVTATAPSLAGVRIEGRIEMDENGAYLRGVIREEIAAEGRFQRVRKAG